MEQATQTAIAFRYDINPDDDQRPYVITYALFGENYRGVWGMEHRNKYGEEIKLHLHYHFYYPAEEKDAKKFIERIRKRIQRANPEKERGYYSIKVIDVNEKNDWLRYPLKQYETLEAAKKHQDPNTFSPDDFDIKTQWLLAHEEYERDKAFLSKSREKKDRRQTTYELIIAYIENKNWTYDNTLPPKNAKMELFNMLLDYHTEEGMPVERNKMKSYMDSLQLKYGLITRTQYYDLVCGP